MDVVKFSLHVRFDAGHTMLQKELDVRMRILKAKFSLSQCLMKRFKQSKNYLSWSLYLQIKEIHSGMVGNFCNVQECDNNFDWSLPCLQMIRELSIFIKLAMHGINQSRKCFTVQNGKVYTMANNGEKHSNGLMNQKEKCVIKQW